MPEESDVDKLIVQLGLGWTKFAKRATGLLKVVITHARSGDEYKTLESLSAFYEAMDFGKMPGDPSHLFLTACELLSSKHLLPSELVPLGALRGSENEGVRYVVLTSVGLAAHSATHFYSAETKFEVLDVPVNLPDESTSFLGNMKKVAQNSTPAYPKTLHVSDSQWEIRALFGESKIESVKRLGARLSAIVGQSTEDSQRGNSPDIIDQLHKAKELHASGVIGDDEFKKLKSRILEQARK